MGPASACRCEPVPSVAWITFKKDGSGATWHKVVAFKHGHLQAS